MTVIQSTVEDLQLPEKLFSQRVGDRERPSCARQVPGERWSRLPIACRVVPRPCHLLKDADAPPQRRRATSKLGEEWKKRGGKQGRQGQANRVKDEMIKLQIEDENKKFIFEKDEHPRKNLNLDDLKKLKTVFKENGTVTPGNSSGINDGAAALVLMSREQADKKFLEPMVKIKSWATCGVEPSLMGLGPIPSIQEALSKANWKMDEVDLFEINEAFAAQSIAVIKELKIPEQKVNVNGGAIALGHPIGASGSRILITLIHEMIKQDKKKGCAALCIGGGMGIAMCIERS